MQVPFFFFRTFTVKNTCTQRTPLLRGREHLKLGFYGLLLETCIKRTLQRECMIFCPHLIDRSFKFSKKLSFTEMQYFIIQACFYSTFLVLVWFCKPSHDSINLDTVAIYLNRLTSSTCHCLWKYGTVFQSYRPFTRMLFVPFKVF